jgi:hypothetical protein
VKGYEGVFEREGMKELREKMEARRKRKLKPVRRREVELEEQ